MAKRTKKKSMTKKHTRRGNPSTERDPLRKFREEHTQKSDVIDTGEPVPWPVGSVVQYVDRSGYGGGDVVIAHPSYLQVIGISGPAVGIHSGHSYWPVAASSLGSAEKDPKYWESGMAETVKKVLRTAPKVSSVKPAAPLSEDEHRRRALQAYQESYPESIRDEDDVDDRFYDTYDENPKQAVDPLRKFAIGSGYRDRDDYVDTGERLPWPVGTPIKAVDRSGHHSAYVILAHPTIIEEGGVRTIGTYSGGGYYAMDEDEFISRSGEYFGPPDPDLLDFVIQHEDLGDAIRKVKQLKIPAATGPITTPQRSTRMGKYQWATGSDEPEERDYGEYEENPMRLGKQDKAVIRAFTEQRAADGHRLVTDGHRIDGYWQGGNSIAYWRDGKIHFSDLGSKAAETVQNAIKREAPKNDLYNGRGYNPAPRYRIESDEATRAERDKVYTDAAQAHRDADRIRRRGPSAYADVQVDYGEGVWEAHEQRNPGGGILGGGRYRIESDANEAKKILKKGGEIYELAYLPYSGTSLDKGGEGRTQRFFRYRSDALAVLNALKHSGQVEDATLFRVVASDQFGGATRTIDEQWRDPRGTRGYSLAEEVESSWNKNPKLKTFEVGDLVRYTANFLRSTGQYASKRQDGVVVGISIRDNGTQDPEFVIVSWNDYPMPSRVNAFNIEKKKTTASRDQLLANARMATGLRVGTPHYGYHVLTRQGTRWSEVGGNQDTAAEATATAVRYYDGEHVDVVITDPNGHVVYSLQHFDRNPAMLYAESTSVILVDEEDEGAQRNPDDDPEILIGQDTAYRAMEWHGGQGTALYSMASSAIAGRPVPRSTIEAAATDLRIAANKAKKRADKAEASVLADRLEAYAEGREVYEVDEDFPPRSRRNNPAPARQKNPSARASSMSRRITGV